VVVPAELRPKPAAPAQVVQFEMPGFEAAPVRKSRPGCIFAVAALVVLFIGLVTFIPIYLTSQATNSVTQMIAPAMSALTELPGALSTQLVATVRVPTRVPTTARTPTPSFARLQTTFGAKGIGAGLLNDARYMAVDGAGMVYVADYQDGRIQVFDAAGKFSHGWTVGDSKTIIDGMTANHQGTLFVAYAGAIYRYEGASGKLLGKVSYANGPEFGDLATTPDGGVAGVWYEGRWGMITSLDGHREDLAWFDASGKTLHILQSVISGQTDDLALDVSVAVDGQGTVYALSDNEIFKFTAQGKFVTRFAATDNASGSYGQSIAVDGAGLVYAAGSDGVAVFNPDGRLLRSFSPGVSADKIAFSEKGDLYILSREKVAIYKLGDLP